MLCILYLCLSLKGLLLLLLHLQLLLLAKKCLLSYGTAGQDILHNQLLKQLLRNQTFLFNVIQTFTLVLIACKLARQVHQVIFPIVASKFVIPFEVLHTDVWGPALTMSIEGYRYYVSFKDECTRYTQIFLIMNRVAFFSIFVHFLAYLKTQFAAHGGDTWTFGIKGQNYP